MSSWSPENSVITNLGSALLAEARVGLVTIKITRVVARENFESSISTAKSYTLSDITTQSIAQTGAIISVKATQYPDPSEEIETSLLKVRFSNDDLPSASDTYNLRQIVIIAAPVDPETQEVGDEIPYMVCQCDDSSDCDVMPARSVNPTSFDYDIYVIHSDVDSITYALRTGGYVYEEDYDEDKTEIWAAINNLNTNSVGQNTSGKSFSTWNPVYGPSEYGTAREWSSESTGSTVSGKASAERFNTYDTDKNIVTGNYSSVFGYNTEVLSDYSVAFGEDNFIGASATHNAVYGSQNSIRAGMYNILCGSINEFISGYNSFVSGTSVEVTASNQTVVIGDSLVVKNVDDSIISGRISSIGTSSANSVRSSLIIGGNLDVDKSATSIVVGSGISCENISNSAVFGVTNSVTGTCSNNLIAGANHTIVSEVSGTVTGDTNTLNNSSYSFVGNKSNEVYSGTCNTVFGYNNTLNTSDYTFICGSENSVTSCSKSFISGGSHSANSSSNITLLGASHTISMSSDYTVVSGNNNKVTHSSRSILGGYSLVVDYANDSILSGKSNRVYGSSQNNSTFISGNNNTVHNDGSLGATEVGNSLITGTNNDVSDYTNGIFGGKNNTIINVTESEVIGISNNVKSVSGQANSIGARNCNVSGQLNSVTQFENSVITGKQNSLSDYIPNGVSGEWGSSINSIIGGEVNIISGIYNSVVAGRENTVSNLHDSVICGNNNTISGGSTSLMSTNSVIVVGVQNTITNSTKPQAVFGTKNTVTANDSLTAGTNLINSSANAVVLGKYNVADANNTYAVIVGGGTTNNRSNVLTVDWSGNLRLSGSIYVGGSNSSLDSLLSDLITEVTTARSTYSNLNARLDAIESSISS